MSSSSSTTRTRGAREKSFMGLYVTRSCKAMVRPRGRFQLAGVEVRADGLHSQTRTRRAPILGQTGRAPHARALALALPRQALTRRERPAGRRAASTARARSAPARHPRPGAGGGGDLHGLRALRRLEWRSRGACARARPRLDAGARARARAGGARARRRRAAGAPGAAGDTTASHRLDLRCSPRSRSRSPRGRSASAPARAATVRPGSPHTCRATAG